MIRRVTAADADALRAIRLRSLAEDPDAFGSTYEREAAWETTTWAEWAAEHAEGTETTTLLTLGTASAIGMVGAFRAENEPGAYHVIAMWVAPEARRQGIARQLLRELESWARAAGGAALLLDVTERAGPARALYESEGFAPDGTTSESRHTRGLVHVRMRKLLVN